MALEHAGQQQVPERAEVRDHHHQRPERELALVVERRPRHRCRTSSSTSALPPMWKFTGSARSAHASHSGSQWRSPRSGRPSLCGSALVFTPRRPRAWIRATSWHGRVDVPPREDRHREHAAARLVLDLGHRVVVDGRAQQLAARGRPRWRTAGRRSRRRWGRRSGRGCRARPSSRGAAPPADAPAWTSSMPMPHELGAEHLRAVGPDHRGTGSRRRTARLRSSTSGARRPRAPAGRVDPPLRSRATSTGRGVR